MLLGQLPLGSSRTAMQGVSSRACHVFLFFSTEVGNAGFCVSSHRLRQLVTDSHVAELCSGHSWPPGVSSARIPAVGGQAAEGLSPALWKARRWLFLEGGVRVWTGAWPCRSSLVLAAGGGGDRFGAALPPLQLSPHLCGPYPWPRLAEGLKVFPAAPGADRCPPKGAP